MYEVTFAKRWRWVESGLLWLVVDRLVGTIKEGKMDSSAPAYTNHFPKFKLELRTTRTKMMRRECIAHCLLEGLTS
jgi:hypothetical protein